MVNLQIPVQEIQLPGITCWQTSHMNQTTVISQYNLELSFK